MAPSDVLRPLGVCGSPAPAGCVSCELVCVVCRSSVSSSSVSRPPIPRWCPVRTVLHLPTYIHDPMPTPPHRRCRDPCRRYPYPPRPPPPSPPAVATRTGADSIQDTRKLSSASAAAGAKLSAIRKGRAGEVGTVARWWRARRRARTGQVQRAPGESWGQLSVEEKRATDSQPLTRPLGMEPAGTCMCVL